MNTYIIGTVVYLVATWYVAGKVFAGNKKEDRHWRWRLRLASIGVLAFVIGATLNKNEVALIGLIILALVIGTGFSRTD